MGKKFHIIGAANIDIAANSTESGKGEEALSGSVHIRYGGTGRNIAEDLVCLKEQVSFTSVFAQDYFGDLLYENCRSLGLDLSFSSRDDDHGCSLCVSTQAENKTSIADTRIFDSFHPMTIDLLAKQVTEEDWVVFDTNVPKEIIEYGMKTLKGHKAADGVSAGKVGRLYPVLSSLDMLKLDLREAEEICGMELDSLPRIISFMKILTGKGLKEILIRDKDTLYIGRKGTYYRYIDETDTPDIDRSGSGEALFASYLFSRSRNASIETSAIVALTAADITKRSEKTSASISREQLRSEISYMNITGGVIFEEQ